MDLEKGVFPEPECSREAAKAWLEREFGASLMVVPDTPGHYYPPHSHDCHEIIVGIEGQIVFRAEGRELAIGAGEVLYLPEGTVHEATVGPAGCEYLIGHSFSA
ncbi:cupin domain-containing protein [Thiohalorhabdus sp.]|uniref:cupin domain-containing protein n=1 Tax=Thiohalorhabdus sp. TaxID=3094134 RepID=UPI002FC3BFAD